MVNGGNTNSNGVAFSRMRAEFTRQTGQLRIKDGVVRGPAVGATIEGNIDYGANQVRMSGTFVPMYGLNNMFGQIPIVGLVLGGGSNEGADRPNLRSRRIARRAGAARQSDLGDGAGRAAQDFRVRHRAANHSGGFRRSDAKLRTDRAATQTGLSST